MRSTKPSQNRSPSLLNQVRRAGFTLIELLIVVGILLILTTISVGVFSATTAQDRIRASARQVQSAVAGARSQAGRYRKARGIRLMPDANDGTVVTGFAYVGVDSFWDQGSIRVGRRDLINNGTMAAGRDGLPDPGYESDATFVLGFDTDWKLLYDQGLLEDGARIKIPNDSTGVWYTVNTYYLQNANYNAAFPDILLLNSSFVGMPSPNMPMLTANLGNGGQPGVNGSDDNSAGGTDDPNELGWPPVVLSGGVLTLDPTEDDTSLEALPDATRYYANPVTNQGKYLLEMRPTTVGGQETLRLASGIAIDLDHSVIPASWYHQVSLATGSSPPAENYDATGTYYNGWGKWWATEVPATAGNTIYRQYSPQMDIVFSPRGSASGTLAASGLIHLRLAEIEDIANNIDPANPVARTQLITTLFPQNGYVATFAVDPTDVLNNSTGMSGTDGYADNPLTYALKGATVGR